MSSVAVLDAEIRTEIEKQGDAMEKKGENIKALGKFRNDLCGLVDYYEDTEVLAKTAGS